MSCDFGEEDPFSFGQPSSGGGKAAASAAQKFGSIPGFIEIQEFNERFKYDDSGLPLGEGSFGKVYVGFDQKPEQPVVVKKIYSRTTPQNPECSPEAIIREATTAMLFDSPHLCKVYGFSVDDAGFVYIAMEIIPGIESFEFFNRNPLLGKTVPLLVLRILRDVARGLATLHSAGFAHRDIKFDNIMLVFGPSGEFERAVIIDFGFTMRISDVPHHSDQGSILYAAPEIAQKKAKTEKVDIWAVGVMLFVLLHGYYPIWSKNRNPTMEAYEVYQKLKKLTESPELPLYTEGDKDINHLRMICARCLEIDQTARISAEELLEMLP
jgi:serine/threonine protein kinase